MSFISDVLALLRPSYSIVKSPQSAGVNQCLHAYYNIGVPTALSPNTTINGAVYSSPAGRSDFLLRGNPPSGQFAFIVSVSAAVLSGGATARRTPLLIFIFDRIWDGRPAINDTSLQSITTPTWPARDDDETSNGKGIFLALEIAATTAAATASATVTYTNSDGTGGRTGSLLIAPSASGAAQGNVFPITLQSGDLGVRSVESIQFATAWATGTINLVAYRVVAIVDVGTKTSSKNAAHLGFIRVFDDSCLYPVVPNLSSTFQITAQITEVHG